MNRSLAVLATLVFASVVTFGQQSTPQGSFLDHLIGKWVLQGTIEGKETTHDVEAEWILNREYVRIHEVSREKNPSGGPAYEAFVFIGWDQRAKEYSCLWLDSTAGGGLSAEGIAHGKPGDNQIPFVFKFSNNESFHNTFIYSPDRDTWQWVMDGEKNGKLELFARLKLTRT